jgi:hypothetical protein
LVVFCQSLRVKFIFICWNLILRSSILFSGSPLGYTWKDDHNTSLKIVKCSSHTWCQHTWHCRLVIRHVCCHYNLHIKLSFYTHTHTHTHLNQWLANSFCASLWYQIRYYSIKSNTLMRNKAIIMMKVTNTVTFRYRIFTPWIYIRRSDLLPAEFTFLLLYASLFEKVKVTF